MVLGGNRYESVLDTEVKSGWWTVTLREYGKETVEEQMEFRYCGTEEGYEDRHDKELKQDEVLLCWGLNAEEGYIIKEDYRTALW